MVFITPAIINIKIMVLMFENQPRQTPKIIPTTIGIVLS